MSAVNQPVETENTANVIISYLVEHLVGERDEATSPAGSGTPLYQVLRVGPFRFVCLSSALCLTPPARLPSVVLEARDLVPASYQARVAALPAAADTCWLDEGRIEIRGCRVEEMLTLEESQFVPREARGASPWICATLRAPPAFVLEPEAAVRHFLGH